MPDLSPRQLRVLRMTADGYTRERIAEEIYASVATVRNIREQIFTKLGADTAAHAVHIAHQYGILTDPADAEAVALVRLAQAMGYRLALVPLEESR